MFDKNAQFDITCPNCKKDFRISVSQVQNEDDIPCPNCPQVFKTGELRTGLEQNEKALEKFRKQNMNAMIKFKF